LGSELVGVVALDERREVAEGRRQGADDEQVERRQTDAEERERHQRETDAQSRRLAQQKRYWQHRTPRQSKGSFTHTPPVAALRVAIRCCALLSPAFRHTPRCASLRRASKTQEGVFASAAQHRAAQRMCECHR